MNAPCKYTCKQACKQPVLPAFFGGSRALRLSGLAPSAWTDDSCTTCKGRLIQHHIVVIDIGHDPPRAVTSLLEPQGGQDDWRGAMASGIVLLKALPSKNLGEILSRLAMQSLLKSTLCNTLPNVHQLKNHAHELVDERVQSIEF